METFYVRFSAKMSLRSFLDVSSSYFGDGVREVKQNVSRRICQVVKISANLASDYQSKCEFKENVLRGRYQNANESVNLAFDNQSRCIPMEFKH